VYVMSSYRATTVAYSTVVRCNHFSVEILDESGRHLCKTRDQCADVRLRHSMYLAFTAGTALRAVISSRLHRVRPGHAIVPSITPAPGAAQSIRD